MNQNVDFSGSDQIQTPQYPDVHLPSQETNIRQLIEECSIEVCKEQKQNMENTVRELVEICHQKEHLCIHDNVDNLIESALNFKLLSINSKSQHPDKKEQEVKNVKEQPAERMFCIFYSNMVDQN
uniref:Uncharacterized protein n=1 Tax=Tanacetum cinerariifolium TaxID=118510 RepID=A0A699JF40_TANCI|nr:hypothetical protein [Tanacetum cinerariifolium]